MAIVLSSFDVPFIIGMKRVRNYYLIHFQIFFPFFIMGPKLFLVRVRSMNLVRIILISCTSWPLAPPP